MIKNHGILDLKFDFLNKEAFDWYDPLKPYTLLEYEWVLTNVNFYDQIVADVGCHHGNYAIVFKGASEVIGVDINKESCMICERNMKLNDVAGEVIHAKMEKGYGFNSITDKLPSVYKMDIEGYEFDLFPEELEKNPQVHTWILELHPSIGRDPNTIADIFKNFELLKVDREIMSVVQYDRNKKWKTHATLIARKEG